MDIFSNYQEAVVNIHHFDRIQVFSLVLFPITDCGTAKIPFSPLNVLAFRVVTLETLNFFAVFCKDQDSGVRVKFVRFLS